MSGSVFALAALVALTSASPAATAPVPVVVVPGLELADLEQLQARGAVGLLVPAAGPRTSGAQARAALVRGEMRNSLRGGIPSGPVLIGLRTAASPPERGPAIVLGLPNGGEQANNRRYPIAVLGAGYRGLLTSDSTRIPGLVSIVDVAPTALGRSDRLGWEAREGAGAHLRELDSRVRENGRARIVGVWVTLLVLGGLAFLFPRAAVLGFGAVLAANLALGVAEVSAPVVVVALALATVIGGSVLAHRLRTPAWVAAAFVVVLAAYLLAFALDGSWLALSPLGPSQNARFYGLSNLLETILLVPAFAGAVLAKRLGWAGFAAVAGLSLVLVSGSRFGADGGGAIVLAVGYVVLGVVLAGASRRAVVLAAAVAGALVLALVGLDVLTGASSHVTESLAGGPEELAGDLAGRVELSVRRVLDAWYVALIVITAILALMLLALRTLRRPLPRPARALLLSFAAAIGASLIVNDSPLEVSVTGLVGFLSLAAYARAEGELAGPSSEP